jgi:hypothetical protein
MKTPFQFGMTTTRKSGTVLLPGFLRIQSIYRTRTDFTVVSIRENRLNDEQHLSSAPLWARIMSKRLSLKSNEEN